MADPVFLITGASSGIGAATARAAAQAGYRLVLAARSVDQLRELADELGGDERALAVTCDVTEWADQEAMVGAALERFGRLDVAFANAGFGAKRGFLAESARALALDGADQRLRRGADDPGDDRRRSRTPRATCCSPARSPGRRALPGSLYSATKWAVTGDGRGRRQELNGTGVRVTLIEPGMVDTPFFDEPAQDGAGRRRRRPGGHVRGLPAAAVDVNEILIRPTDAGGIAAPGSNDRRDVTAGARLQEVPDAGEPRRTGGGVRHRRRVRRAGQGVHRRPDHADHRADLRQARTSRRCRSRSTAATSSTATSSTT